MGGGGRKKGVGVGVGGCVGGGGGGEERPGLHTTANSENSKRALVGDFGLDPRREGRQNEKWGGRVKKKSEILGGPAEGGRGGGGLGEVGQTNSTNYDWKSRSCEKKKTHGWPTA